MRGPSTDILEIIIGHIMLVVPITVTPLLILVLISVDGTVWARSGTAHGWRKGGGGHAGYVGGLGYQRGVMGKGTPGYHNDVVKNTR